MIHTLRHWLTPHHTNNFRARLLHNAGIFGVIGIYVAATVFVRLLESTPLHILGFTSSITIDEVVRMTNEQRVASGLQPLTYNEKLADAARRKAANMIAENYWAHNSPSGKNPWVWFKEAGYSYVNAGENLAKDFGSTDRMVSAWMASPTHKANIVSDKYKEIGIAVVPGTLQGQETVLVVQLFGSSAGGSVASSATTPEIAAVKIQETPRPTPRATAAAKSGANPVMPTVEPTVIPANTEVLELKEFATPVPKGNSNFASFNVFNLKKTVSLVTTGLLILVLLADVIFAESRRLSRRVGKNWAHILFINVILILVTIVQAGSIL